MCILYDLIGICKKERNVMDDAKGQKYFIATEKESKCK